MQVINDLTDVNSHGEEGRGGTRDFLPVVQQIPKVSDRPKDLAANLMECC